MRLQKVGIVLSVAILSVISFISGVEINNQANSAGSSSALPVSKGGTGQNNLANVIGVGSANKLATPRTINNVEFDGSKDVIIPQGYNSEVPIPAEDGCYYFKLYNMHQSVTRLEILISPDGNATSTYINFVSKSTAAVSQYDLYVGEKEIPGTLQYRYSWKPVGSNSIYFKIRDVPAGRNLYWNSSAPTYVKYSTITDPEEISQLNSTPWKAFNMIVSNTPSNAPTP